MCPLPGDGGEWCRQAQTAGPWGQTHLHWCITVVHQKGKANHWDQEELQPERVILHVKCFPELPIDHVHSDIGTEEENNLGRQGHHFLMVIIRYDLCNPEGQYAMVPQHV